MAIIYSYPKETNPQPTDLLIGTSTVTVDGKQSNVTRSYSLQTITDYIKTLGGVGVQSITFNTPLTGGTITNTGTVSIPQADTTTDGYISSADWNTFNDKLGGIAGTQYKIPIWSTTSALGNSSLTETGGGTTITSDKTFAPSSDNTKDLGVTSTARWKDAFLAGTVSTANITMTGTLSANGSTGTSGYVLQSKGAGTPVEWLDLTTVADKYDLSAAQSGSDANLNLTSTSTGDDSQVKFIQGSNIALTVDSTGSPNTITIAANTQGSVTNVSSTDTNTINIINNTTTPEVTAITTGGVGASNTNLVTGGQVQTAIDNALIGSVTFKGGFNATTGVIDGTANNLTIGASRVAIAVGDLYVVTTAGNFYGSEPLGVGDQVICQTAASVGNSTINDWTTVESNVVPATAGATDAGTTKGVASFDNQMFAATADGFITSTTLNSINITVGGGVFVVDGNSQEDMYLARGTTFFINQDDN